MKTKIRRTQQEIKPLLADIQNGRDEMNLVDLPICLLSTRSPNGSNIREFEIEEFDKKLKTIVHRQVTVTGSPKFGLPTAAADKVQLALLHYTRAANNFTSPKVFFSRGELLKILNWPNKDSSYRRLACAMDQLAGVRLKCVNYWRDNQIKDYRRETENFAIIDYYRFRDSRKKAGRDFQEYLSEFQWAQFSLNRFLLVT